MDTQILQGNVSGPIHNLDDVKDLLCNITPKVLCVQETYLKSTQTNCLGQYSIFCKDLDGTIALPGGVASIVDKLVPAVKTLNASEAVAI